MNCKVFRPNNHRTCYPHLPKLFEVFLNKVCTTGTVPQVHVHTINCDFTCVFPRYDAWLSVLLIGELQILFSLPF